MKVKEPMVVIVDGEPQCSECGGSVLANCLVDADQVPVEYDEEQMMLIPDVTEAGSQHSEIATLRCTQCGAQLLPLDVVELDGGAMRISLTPEGNTKLGTVIVNGVFYHVEALTPEEFAERGYNLDSEVAEGIEQFQTDAAGLIYVFAPYLDHGDDEPAAETDAKVNEAQALAARWWGERAGFTEEEKALLQATYSQFESEKAWEQDGGTEWVLKDSAGIFLATGVSANIEDLDGFASCVICGDVHTVDELDDAERCSNCEDADEDDEP